jgi:uncharacterized protein (DUF169 family)
MFMYRDLALKLKKYAMLQKDPVAIYLSKKPPEGVKKVEGKVAFCKMFDIAREKRECIYASAGEQDCQTGIHVLGMGVIDPAVRRGDPDYEEHGISPSLRIARRAFSHRHALEANSVSYVTVCPLDKAQSEPDVVFVQGKPANASLLTYAYINFLGRYPLGLAGNAFCSACVAAPYLTGEMTYGLGLHYFGGPPNIMKYQTDEMFIGIPGELLKPIVEQLEAQNERVSRFLEERRRRAEQEAAKKNQ